MNLKLTQSFLSRPYVVHELLFKGEEIECSENLHVSELKGRNILQKEDGTWDVEDNALGLSVQAGPILHTSEFFSFQTRSVDFVLLLTRLFLLVNCIGYVFTEHPRAEAVKMADYLPHLKSPVNVAALLAAGVKNPLSLISQLTNNRIPITLADGTVLQPPLMGGKGRKLVILGDTYDASGCESIAQDADFLVHESTNAYMPDLDESQSKPITTFESVLETAKSHGHSVPEVAGDFAKRINAKMLALNHLSIKYMPVGEFEEGESESTGLKRKLLERIGELASKSWGGGSATVAYDFLEIEIPRKKD